MDFFFKNPKNINKIIVHQSLILCFNSKFNISFLLNCVVHWVESSDCNKYTTSTKPDRISEILTAERTLIRGKEKFLLTFKQKILDPRTWAYTVR